MKGYGALLFVTIVSSLVVQGRSQSFIDAVKGLLPAKESKPSFGNIIGNLTTATGGAAGTAQPAEGAICELGGVPCGRSTASLSSYIHAIFRSL